MTTQTNSLNILRIDASMRRDGSVSRGLADGIVDALRRGAGSARVVTRDLADGIPLIDETWIGANFTDAEDRTQAQAAALAFSDTLVAELEAADAIVIAVPVYNFAVPAALKAWVDLISRARKTFRYSEDGPVGLLGGRKAYLAVASGGTEVGSAGDFATGYLQYMLNFVGIDDVTVIAADRLMLGAEESIAGAKARIAALAKDAARLAA